MVRKFLIVKIFSPFSHRIFYGCCRTRYKMVKMQS
jgi:hypothetical protein